MTQRCAWFPALLIAIVATCLFCVHPASADTAADRATARNLATEGVKLYENKKYVEAIDRLERAQALMAAPTHLLYLARSRAGAGQLVHAAETYRELIRFPISADASAAFRSAVETGKAELAALEPKIPTLRISVEPAQPEKLELRIDGEVISTAVIGVDRPIDPGRHVVTGKAPGHAEAESTVEVAAGAHETVTLRLRPEPGGKTSSEASAPSPEASAAPEKAGQAPPESVRRHDGFYLRLAIGAGRFEDRFEIEDVGLLGLQTVQGSAVGASASFELAAGGTIAKGLVIGGGVLVEQVTNPSVEVEGQTVDQDISVGTFVLVGPIVDWYMDPTGGLHLQGALGGARITIRDSSGQEDTDNQPVGAGASVGVGYEFWVADQLSLGILGRFVVATLSDEGFNHTVNAPALLLTGTYH